MKRRRLPLPRCHCGARLTRAEKNEGHIICSPCEAKVEQRYRELAAARAEHIREEVAA